MGIRGLPKTPNNILKARGSWRAKLPERAEEPKSLPEAPIECPAVIADDPDAKDYWDGTICPLFAYGIITVADVRTVVRMCRAWSRLEAASKIVAEDGVTVATEKGVASHPALAAINGANEILNRLEPQFGIMPANRSRVTNAITKRPAGEAENKARFFVAKAG